MYLFFYLRGYPDFSADLDVYIEERYSYWNGKSTRYKCSRKSRFLSWELDTSRFLSWELDTDSEITYTVGVRKEGDEKVSLRHCLTSATLKNKLKGQKEGFKSIVSGRIRLPNVVYLRQKRRVHRVRKEKIIMSGWLSPVKRRKDWEKV